MEGGEYIYTGIRVAICIKHGLASIIPGTLSAFIFNVLPCIASLQHSWPEARKYGLGDKVTEDHNNFYACRHISLYIVSKDSVTKTTILYIVSVSPQKNYLQSYLITSFTLICII